MSYTVLARKYRSRNFDEIVGQEPVATTLRNAITSDRVHHGYLFTGTRGVGKTSMARILAKALNCLSADAPTIKPCGDCESCRAVAEGEDIDVVEIDAASNTGVDNIRDLISNAAYRPARARHKIYIIDEVHMLSTGAFNALLKILEEPPDHVKFIFATTTPQKVPATILSRVQRFDFRAIGSDKIAGQLQHILQSENITADESIVRRIARQANGSMRDALSLLDQVLSLGVDKLTPELIDEVLPASYDDDLAAMIGAFADSQPAVALTALDAVIAKGFTLERFAETLIDQLRSLMLLRICGPDSELVDLPTTAQDQAQTQCARFEPTQYVYMIALLEELRRNVRFNAAARPLADAAVVRLSQTGRFTNIEELLSRLGSGSIDSKAPAARPNAKKKATEPVEKLTPAVPESSARPAPAATPPTPSTPPTPPTRSAPPRSAGASPTPSASPAASSTRSPSQELLATARKDPLVQSALELFDGNIVDVSEIPSDTLPGTEPEIAG